MFPTTAATWARCPGTGAPPWPPCPPRAATSAWAARTAPPGTRGWNLIIIIIITYDYKDYQKRHCMHPPHRGPPASAAWSWSHTCWPCCTPPRPTSALPPLGRGVGRGTFLEPFLHSYFPNSAASDEFHNLFIYLPLMMRSASLSNFLFTSS